MARCSEDERGCYTQRSMDVERTMEFILQMQAKAEVRTAKAEARMDKFDKRLESMRKLVETGMKILVKVDKTLLEVGDRISALTVQVNALTEAQRKSDRKFDRLMDSWAKQRSNGHQQRS